MLSVFCAFSPPFFFLVLDKSRCSSHPLREDDGASRGRSNAVNVVREVLCLQKRCRGEEESVRPVDFEHEEVNQHVSLPGTSCSLPR
jgi:hypothetical protein